jgi:hypothetical protein
MIEIWTDLYIAIGAKTVHTKTLKKNINYIPLVLKKYEIDSAQFNTSNIYYISRLDEYESMFEKVRENLRAMKAKEIKINYNSKSQTDSIHAEVNDSILLEKKNSFKKRLIKN